MSDPDVPDVDMPDSFLTDAGPGPDAGHGLDELLSGAGGDVSAGLRQVARALDALRAAPLPEELSGEAEARAAFRQVMRPAGARQPRPGQVAGGAVAAGGGARVLRHRHRRPAVRRGRWRPRALAGAAVLVVAVGVAGVAGTLMSVGRPASSVRGAGASSAAGSTASGMSGTDGSAVPVPGGTSQSEAAPPSGNRAAASDLCHQYLAFSEHSGQQQSAAQREVLDQLGALAGGAGSVGYYCTRVLQPWAAAKQPGSLPGVPGTVAPSDAQGQQGSDAQGRQGSGSQGSQAPPGGQGSLGAEVTPTPSASPTESSTASASASSTPSASPGSATAGGGAGQNGNEVAATSNGQG